MGMVSFVDRGIADDQRKLANAGIDSFGDEAMPYYARWIREDLIAVCYLLNRIASIGFILLMLIAIPLWMIALR